MSPLEAILLGIVQGLTEFLPISSTAHLRVIPALLGWSDPGAAFTAVIQCGTLAAVLTYFRGELTRIAAATLRGLAQRRPWDHPDARMGWMIVLGTIPIVLAGVLVRDAVHDRLRSLYVISAALIGLGLLLGLAESLMRRRFLAGWSFREWNDLGWADALLVGAAQALSLVPGSSRSGVTITGGLFLGMSRATAARFSFLLSVPSVLAAGVFELWQERETLLASSAGAVNLALATVVSGVVGYAAIAFLLRFLRTRTTWIFVAYRVALGGLLLGLLAAGRLAD